jgi:hypothetical protein
MYSWTSLQVCICWFLQENKLTNFNVTFPLPSQFPKCSYSKKFYSQNLCMDFSFQYFNINIKSIITSETDTFWIMESHIIVGFYNVLHDSTPSTFRVALFLHKLVKNFVQPGQKFTHSLFRTLSWSQQFNFNISYSGLSCEWSVTHSMG